MCVSRVRFLGEYFVAVRMTVWCCTDRVRTWSVWCQLRQEVSLCGYVRRLSDDERSL